MSTFVFLKKKKRFFVKWFLVIVLSLLAFDFMHDLATQQRGYNAVGGEIFAFVIPLLVWAAPEIKKTFKMFKD